MGSREFNFLIPIEYFNSWWVDIESERLNCTAEVLVSAPDPDGRIYRKIRFSRNGFEVVARTLPCPHNREDVFVLVVGPHRNRLEPSGELLLLDIETALERLGAECVYRPHS